MSYEEELLSHDVVIEILSWLPPETLVKFKSVCKSWYSTINDGKFIANHQSHFGNFLQCNNRRIVIASEKYTRSFLYVELALVEESDPRIIYSKMELKIPIPQSEYYRMMCSCNGMFLYASSRVDYGPIQLCNPSIKWTHPVAPYSLVSNPFNRVCYGVGFDQSTNDYKVLKFVFGHPEIGIYSVKTKSWKIIINATSRLNATSCYSHSVFLNGFIHSLSYTSKTWKIMLFDVCNEVFGEMQLPELGKLEGNVMSIYVVKGKLCLLVEEAVRHNIICHVWTMKEYGVEESWNKNLTVVVRKAIRPQLTVGGKILYSTYYNSFGLHNIFLYDPETEGIRNVGRAQFPFSLCSMVASL